MPRMNAGHVTSEDDLTGNYPKPGRYLVVVSGAEEKPDQVSLTVEVLGGTVPGQAGKGLTETFNINEKQMPRLMKCAMALGLLKPGEDKDVDFRHAIGRPMVVQVELREGREKGADGKYKSNGKMYHNFTYDGMWRIDHPDVGDVVAIPDCRAAILKFWPTGIAPNAPHVAAPAPVQHAFPGQPDYQPLPATSPAYQPVAQAPPPAQPQYQQATHHAAAGGVASPAAGAAANPWGNV